MAFSDRMLTCRECGVEFAFTAGEQEFFAQKGFTNEPGRCPTCRANRRASGGSRMNSYDGEGDMGYSRPRESHETVCASCGGLARVPFIPRGDRPVYCSNCFERERSYR